MINSEESDKNMAKAGKELFRENKKLRFYYFALLVLSL